MTRKTVGKLLDAWVSYPHQGRSNPFTLWVKMVANPRLSLFYSKQFFSSLESHNYNYYTKQDILVWWGLLGNDLLDLQCRLRFGGFFSHYVRANLHKPSRYSPQPWNGEAFRAWADERVNDYRFTLIKVWPEYHIHMKVAKTLVENSKSTRYSPEYDAYDDNIPL